MMRAGRVISCQRCSSNCKLVRGKLIGFVSSQIIMQCHRGEAKRITSSLPSKT